MIASQERQGIRLHEPKYALPMVGRAAELALIEQKLDLALQGHGQIVGITAEAGMGKSRLMAEVIRLARGRNVLGYGGECQSYGTSTSYLVWQNIWRGFFESGSQPAHWRNRSNRWSDSYQRLTRLFCRACPCLGRSSTCQIPDNELTGSFDAKLRKESLESLLVDCLRKRARSMPLLLVLEDCHWLDPLSHDLLEVIGRAIVDLPVLIVIAYRPPQLNRLLAPRVSKFFHFTEIPLTDLPAEEIEQLVSFKLGQIYGEQAKLPQALIEKISQPGRRQSILYRGVAQLSA